MAKHKELMMLNNVMMPNETTVPCDNDLVRPKVQGESAKKDRAEEPVEASLLALSAQDLSEPTGCCSFNQECIDKYFAGELSAQEIKYLLTHCEQCIRCAAEKKLENLIRCAVKRQCEEEQAPAALRVKIIIRISDLSNRK